MNTQSLRADFLLLVTATIWGSAFVAQRMGMDHIGPLTFNAVRFALGAASLIPLILFMQSRRPAGINTATPKQLMRNGGLMGLALFFGASFQQWGVVYTTAGKAGFITGLYVVLVPIMGLCFKHATNKQTWIGAGLAVAGMYLLSVTDSFTLEFGDLLVLVSAFFWAGHVLLVGFTSPGIDSTDAVKLASVQFACCAILSGLSALVLETITLSGIIAASGPILFGGLCSVGIAYTLQVIAQHDAPPAHAAIILSLEAVFAVLAGWLILDETMTLRALLGCGIMLVGMLISQIKQ
ncbi:MAG: DMT family transporter [Desulfovibrio sp.]